MKPVLKSTNLKSYNAGDKIVTPSGNVVVYNVDKKFMFFSSNKVASTIASKIHASSSSDICLILTDITEYFDKLMVLQLIAKKCYKFDKYISKRVYKTIYIKDSLKNKPVIEKIIQQILVVDLNRDFQNEPANIIYPETFVEYAKKMLPSSSKVSITVMDELELKRSGLNLISEMGKASEKPPRFMIIKNKKSKPKCKTICIVGKGVTFDSGSINLKRSSDNIYQMKSDKLGATTVISIIKYFVENKIEVNLIGLIPLIENAISGNVVYPGNIIKSYSGLHVEVLNTDAEGRLILADALSYSNKFAKKIDYIFDIATLTGAAENFHCDTVSAVMTFNKKLRDVLDDVSEKVGERIYHMPAWPEYVSYTNSDVADVQNNDASQCERSGAFMAGMFLYRFVPDALKDKWVHFDVTHSYTHHLSNGNATILILNLILALL